MSAAPNRKGTRGETWVAAGLALALAAAPARASSLQRLVALAEAQVGNPYPAYFQAALQRHRLDVRIPAEINRVAIQALGRIVASGAALPETPFVAYLRWRQALDPARFDRFHPRLATLLEATPPLRIAALPPPVPPPPILPRLTPGVGGEGVTPPPPPLTGPGPSVPEPPTAAMILAMIGPAAWMVRASRRRAR